MPKNKLSDLRDHLFETIEALKDEEKPMATDRAAAICKVSREIIESAKVEVKYAEATGAIPCADFFEDRPKLPALAAVNGRRA